MVFVVGLQSDITAAREMEAARQKLFGMTNRLSKINALTSFRSKTVARGLEILDTE